MDDEAVANYAERSKSLIESSPQMDEQNTRSRLIDPFIKDVLGWDFYSTTIEMEYSIQMGSRKKKVDYALFHDDSPAVFVEAKGCDTKLSDDHLGQLRSYMQQEWVDWGLLTNGKEFHLLRLHKENDTPSIDLLGKSSLEDLPKNTWIVSAISKRSVLSGESEDIYERIRRRREAIGALSERKDKIAEEIRRLVVKHAGDVVSQPAESLSKHFVDELITELENGRDGDIHADTTQQPPVSGNESSQSTEVAGEYIVRVRSGQDTTVFSDDSQTEVMGSVVDLLIRDHGLIDMLSPLPYVPGRKRAILNTSPTDPSGEEMRLYERVGEEYFLNTNLNKDSKIRYLRTFGDRCDVEIELGGSW